MENVAPVRALNRRSAQLLQYAFIFAALGVFVGLGALLLNTIPLLARNHSLFNLYLIATQVGMLLGGAGLVAAVMLAGRALTRRKENDLAYLVGDYLAAQLDGRYSFIRNINRPGLGYIDAVLLGPPGILVLRITAAQGVYANEREKWLEQAADGTWKLTRADFSNETLHDAKTLQTYLTRRQVTDAPIFGAVVFINDDRSVRFTLKEPSVPVVYLHTLPTALNSAYFAQLDRMPQATVTVVRRLLLD